MRNAPRFLCVKFAYIEKLQYLCTVLFTFILRIKGLIIVFPLAL